MKWICGGGPGIPIRYGYGYWTGPDSDLLCVVDEISSANFAEIALSPISQFRCWAFILFLVKCVGVWIWIITKGKMMEAMLL